MSHRSVIESLDLHNNYGEYHRDASGAPAFGWLSPRISFSTDFVSGSSDRFSPEKKRGVEGADSPNNYPAEFEFSMPPADAAGSGTPGFIVPADELFHKGKLLPGFLPPNSSGKDDIGESDTTSPLSEGHLGSATTISRHLNAEATGAPSSLGCVLGPSCLRTPKGPKWRELFGALRRVKSDSGRQRIPEESLLPPKTLNGKKKFFKQIFGTGSDVQEPTPKPSSTHAPHTRSSSSSSSSSATASSVAPSTYQGKNSSWDSAPRHSSRAMASSAADSRSKSSGVYTPHSSSSEVGSDFRGKGCGGQSTDGFTFNPTPSSRPRPSSGVSSSNSNGSRAGSPIKVPIRGANFGRSPSGRVIVRGLDRVASGRNAASLQEQVRALRSREIRRSPDRSGYANVRVTPVLNVPVCMGPVLRGATKAGKGRLSNFRSFLTFKSKLPTAMYTSPIATR